MKRVLSYVPVDDNLSLKREYIDLDILYMNEEEIEGAIREYFGGATYWVKDDMIQFKSGDIYVDKPLSVFKKEIIEINENNQRADYLNAINYFEKVRSTWIMKEKEGSV